MTKGEQKKEIKPLKYGVSIKPLAIVVKYSIGESSKRKHHLINLEEFKDKLVCRPICLFIDKNHGIYFPGKLIGGNEFVEKLVQKLIDKYTENRKPKPFNKKAQPEESKPVIRQSLSPQPKKSGMSKDNDESQLLEVLGESIRSEEDEWDEKKDFTDLGRQRKSRISNENLPSLFKNQSLSKSKLSNLVDSKNNLAGGRMSDRLGESQSERDKIFEESGTKFPYRKENLPGLNNSISDKFEDDFESVKEEKGRDSNQKVDVDEFLDDFDEEIKSMKKSANDFEEIDDFEEIPDDVEESVPSQKNRKPEPSKPQPAKEINIDIKTANLNKLSAEEVEYVKKKMDEKFKMLKPGDEGYVYDKSVSFSQAQSGEWNEEDDW